MLGFFKRRKMAKRLVSLGSCVDVSFLLYVNNNDPISFPSQEDCFQFIKNYRSETDIFKLQIFRIETYSL